MGGKANVAQVHVVIILLRTRESAHKHSVNTPQIVDGRFVCQNTRVPIEGNEEFLVLMFAANSRKEDYRAEVPHIPCV